MDFGPKLAAGSGCLFTCNVRINQQMTSFLCRIPGWTLSLGAFAAASFELIHSVLFAKSACRGKDQWKGQMATTLAVLVSFVFIFPTVHCRKASTCAPCAQCVPRLALFIKLTKLSPLYVTSWLPPRPSVAFANNRRDADGAAVRLAIPPLYDRMSPGLQRGRRWGSFTRHHCYDNCCKGTKEHGTNSVVAK